MCGLKIEYFKSARIPHDGSPFGDLPFTAQLHPKTKGERGKPWF
jgi:hypothetical protein